jgi:DNA-binding transcriptional LysR family regulator
MHYFVSTRRHADTVSMPPGGSSANDRRTFADHFLARASVAGACRARPMTSCAHDCLCFSPLRPEAEWRFRVDRAAVVVPVSGPLRADGAEALRRAALARAGVVLLPAFRLATDLARGRLVRVSPDYPLTPVGVFAVYAWGEFVPTNVRRFVDCLVAEMRAGRGPGPVAEERRDVRRAEA